MKRLRLLVLLFTVLAVAFTGMSTASADERRGSDEAKIYSVSNAYGSGDRSKELSIEVVYKCKDSDRGKLKVTLTQDNGKKAKYEGDAKVKCDNKKHDKDVTLRRVKDGDKFGYARNGKAEVKVTLRAGNADDHEKFDVRVKRAGDRR